MSAAISTNDWEISYFKFSNSWINGIKSATLRWEKQNGTRIEPATDSQWETREREKS